MRIRMRWIAACFICALSAAAPAEAGVPVIDKANLMQAVMEVLHSVEQISNQVAQIENQSVQIRRAEDTLNAMTGRRNLGTYMNNRALQNYLPPDSMTTYNALVGGYSVLQGAARTLRDAEMIYNCMDKPEGLVRNRCQATLARPYQQKASMQTAMEISNGRSEQINGLLERINTTSDPKEIAELQARIDGENALLLHELARASYAQGVYDADERAERNREEEMRMDALTRNGSILDRFAAP